MATKTSHFTIAFSVDHSHDSFEGVTPQELFAALMARVADIQRHNEWKEATAHDETEDKDPVTDGAESEAYDGSAYISIQEGGSSMERYLFSGSESEAHAFRVDCTRKGSYRTSEVIRIPGELAMFGETLYQLLEQVSMLELSYVEDDEDEEEETEA